MPRCPGVLTLGAALLSATLCLAAHAASPEGDNAGSNRPATDRQIAVMLLVDYARSYGYQIMMARIQLDRTQAQLDRDAVILEQKRELRRRNVAPEIELEIADLKDVWNRAQLIVARKNLDYVSAEYQAMVKLAHHFGGSPATTSDIYATFRAGWEAGCAKGPDEAVAAKARFEFMQKVVERARQLNEKHLEPLSSLLEKQTELDIAGSEYRNRAESVERCRTLLFPTLEEIDAIGGGSRPADD